MTQIWQGPPVYISVNDFDIEMQTGNSHFTHILNILNNVKKKKTLDKYVLFPEMGQLVDGLVSNRNLLWCSLQFGE